MHCNEYSYIEEFYYKLIKVCVYIDDLLYKHALVIGRAFSAGV